MMHEGLRKHQAERVVIGIDPHKRSVTIEAMFGPPHRGSDAAPP